MKFLIFLACLILVTSATKWGAHTSGCKSWGQWSACKSTCQQCKWCKDGTFEGPYGWYTKGGGGWGAKGGGSNWEEKSAKKSTDYSQDYTGGNEFWQKDYNGDYTGDYAHQGDYQGDYHGDYRGDYNGDYNGDYMVGDRGRDYMNRGLKKATQRGKGPTYMNAVLLPGKQVANRGGWNPKSKVATHKRFGVCRDCQDAAGCKKPMAPAPNWKPAPPAPAPKPAPTWKAPAPKPAPSWKAPAPAPASKWRAK